MPKDEYCHNCKLRKPDKTCKYSEKEQTRDFNWCSGWKKKK